MRVKRSHCSWHSARGDHLGSVSQESKLPSPLQPLSGARADVGVLGMFRSS